MRGDNRMACQEKLRKAWGLWQNLQFYCPSPCGTAFTQTYILAAEWLHEARSTEQIGSARTRRTCVHPRLFNFVSLRFLSAEQKVLPALLLWGSPTPSASKQISCTNHCWVSELPSAETNFIKIDKLTQKENCWQRKRQTLTSSSGMIAPVRHPCFKAASWKIQEACNNHNRELPPLSIRTVFVCLFGFFFLSSLFCCCCCFFIWKGTSASNCTSGYKYSPLSHCTHDRQSTRPSIRTNRWIPWTDASFPAQQKNKRVIEENSLEATTTQTMAHALE